MKKEISKEDYFKNTDSVYGKMTRDLCHYEQNVTLQKRQLEKKLFQLNKKRIIP